ncbi:hypothetical protein AVEN_210868-1 [Araneus ventricosus]|uniref:Uncharacterized protein n=1 Tax=Araneus ventricosus TaxID=182803 RepID=A0A4Y2WUC4_ARAVE|nr:hypothetical protein AVEN_210868-1 [Araneus ventricosus]
MVLSSAWTVCCAIHSPSTQGGECSLHSAALQLAVKQRRSRKHCSLLLSKKSGAPTKGVQAANGALSDSSEGCMSFPSPELRI